MEKQADPGLKKWHPLRGIAFSSVLLLALLFAVLTRLNEKVGILSNYNQAIEQSTRLSHLSSLLHQIRTLAAFTSSKDQDKRGLEEQFKVRLSALLIDKMTNLSTMEGRGQQLPILIQKILHQKISSERNPVLLRRYGILIQEVHTLRTSIAIPFDRRLISKAEMNALESLNNLISESNAAFGQILRDGSGLFDEENWGGGVQDIFRLNIEAAELLLFRVADLIDALRPVFPEIETPIFENFMKQGHQFIDDSQGLLDRKSSSEPFVYIDSGFQVLDSAMLIHPVLAKEMKKPVKEKREQLDLLRTGASVLTMLTILVNATVLIRLYQKKHMAYTRLLQAKDYGHLILNHMFDAVITSDEKGKIEQMNPAAERIFGYSIDELRGKSVHCLSVPQGKVDSDSDLATYFKSNGRATPEVIPEVLCQRCDGSIFHALLVMTPCGTSKTPTFTGILQDLSQHKLTQETLKQTETKLEKANKGLKHLLLFDGLTQIPDRSHFEQRLEEELNRARRENADLSLIICDIDYLKQFIQSCGRISGDDGLRRVAEVIKGNLLRSVDLLARYGGETFAVILPSTDAKGAKTLAEQIKKSLWQENISHPASFIADRVTLSIGITSNQFDDNYRIEPLIERTDQALFLAKNKGKNRIELKV